VFAAACSEVPPQLQRSSRLQELRLRWQQPPDAPLALASAEAMCMLLHSHRQDLPAWLLELQHLRMLQVGGAHAAGPPHCALRCIAFGPGQDSNLNA
jgi:hypothetical protein